MKKFFQKSVLALAAALSLAGCYSCSDKGKKDGAGSVADAPAMINPLDDPKDAAALMAGSSINAALLKSIPASADVVAVGDLTTLLASADVTLNASGLHLPAYLTRILADNGVDASDMMELQEVAGILATSGLDLSGIGVFGNISDHNPVIVAHLLDAQKFMETLTDAGFAPSSRSDCALLSNDEYVVAISGDWAYATQNDSYSSTPAADVLTAAIAATGSKPFSSLAISEYLAQGNLGGLSVKIPAEIAAECRKQGVPEPLANAMSGYVCAKSALSGGQLLVEVRNVDNDGNIKNANNLIPGVCFDTPVNQKALEYLSPNTNFVLALNMGDLNYDKIVGWMQEQGMLSRSEVSQFNSVKTYLEDVKGTVAIGMGYDGGLDAIEAMDRGRVADAVSHLSFSAVVELKSGKGSEIMSQLKGLAPMAGGNYRETSNGFAIRIPDFNKDVYVANVNDLLVISTDEVSGARKNAISNFVNFGSYTGGIALAMPKNAPLLRDLGVDCGITAAMLGLSSGSVSVFGLKVEGTSDNLITALIKNAAKVYETMNSKNRLFAVNSYDDDYDSGYAEYVEPNVYY